MDNIDTYLSAIWNSKNKAEPIVEENFWDYCRILERDGFLVGDNAAITAISIGPFKIASTVDIKRKDLLIYFFETIIPIIFSKASGLPFEQVYSLYLLPATNLLINLADQSYWIKDLLQWEILMYIRNENKNKIYPTNNEIKELDIFKEFEDWQIDDAIRELNDFKNALGDKHNLIITDYEGRMECLI